MALHKPQLPLVLITRPFSHLYPEFSAIGSVAHGKLLPIFFSIMAFYMNRQTPVPRSPLVVKDDGDPGREKVFSMQAQLKGES
jgi:hypothetical protein